MKKPFLFSYYSNGAVAYKLVYGLDESEARVYLKETLNKSLEGKSWVSYSERNFTLETLL
jgi:hypothetical protein